MTFSLEDTQRGEGVAIRLMLNTATQHVEVAFNCSSFDAPDELDASPEACEEAAESDVHFEEDICKAQSNSVIDGIEGGGSLVLSPAVSSVSMLRKMQTVHGAMVPARRFQEVHVHPSTN